MDTPSTRTQEGLNLGSWWSPSVIWEGTGPLPGHCRDRLSIFPSFILATILALPYSPNLFHPTCRFFSLVLGLPCSVPLHVADNKWTVVGGMGVLGQTSSPALPQARYTGGKIPSICGSP